MRLQLLASPRSQRGDLSGKTGGIFSTTTPGLHPGLPNGTLKGAEQGRLLASPLSQRGDLSDKTGGIFSTTTPGLHPGLPNGTLKGAEQRRLPTSPLSQRGDRGGIFALAPTSPLSQRGDRGGIFALAPTSPLSQRGNLSGRTGGNSQGSHPSPNLTPSANSFSSSARRSTPLASSNLPTASMASSRAGTRRPALIPLARSVAMWSQAS